jgi:hypothetical protein
MNLQLYQKYFYFFIRLRGLFEGKGLAGCLLIGFGLKKG